MINTEIEELKSIIRLHKGKENAVPVSELVKHFQVEERLLRSVVEKLIYNDGFPICSSSAGYYFPTNPQEARKSVEHHRKAAARLFLRSRRIIKNAHLFYETSKPVQERLI